MEFPIRFPYRRLPNHHLLFQLEEKSQNDIENHNKQHLLPYPSSSSSSVIPDLLKHNPNPVRPSRPTKIRNRNAKLCSSSIIDFKSNDLFKLRRHNSQNDPQYIISRRERKILWNCAIRTLTDNISTSESLYCDVPCTITKIPNTVLDTNQSILSWFHLRKAPAHRPKQNIQIQSITTTICFDIEFLRNAADSHVNYAETTINQDVQSQFLQMCISSSPKLQSSLFPIRSHPLINILPAPNIAPDFILGHFKLIQRTLDIDHQSFSPLQWTKPMRTPLSSIKAMLCDQLKPITFPSNTKQSDISLSFTPQSTISNKDNFITIFPKLTNTKHPNEIEYGQILLSIISPSTISVSHDLMSRSIETYKPTRRIQVPRSIFSILPAPFEQHTEPTTSIYKTFNTREALIEMTKHCPSTRLKINTISAKLLLKIEGSSVFKIMANIQQKVSFPAQCVTYSVQESKKEFGDLIKQVNYMTDGKLLSRIGRQAGIFEYVRLGNHHLDLLTKEQILPQIYDDRVMMKSNERLKCGKTVGSRVDGWNENERKRKRFKGILRDSDDDEDKQIIDRDMTINKPINISLTIPDKIVQQHHQHQQQKIDDSNKQHQLSELIYGKKPENMKKVTQISIPKNMIHSSWSIQIVEHCLSNTRTILLPPPRISILPSLAILTESYLINGSVDSRIAIICDSGNKEDLRHIHTYFKSCLKKTTSISIINCTTPENNLDNGIDCTTNESFENSSTIIIVDRLSTILKIHSFSLLLILICIPNDRIRNPLQNLRTQDSNRWKLIPNIVISPLNIWTGFEIYTKRACVYGEKLNIMNMSYISNCSEINEMLILEKDRVLFINPIKDGKKRVICNALEEESGNCLKVYNGMERFQRWNKISSNVVGIPEAKCLKDVSISFLKEYISCLEYWDEETEQMAHLLDIKHIESYILQNGIETAMEYIEECKIKHQIRKHLFEKLSLTIDKHINQHKMFPKEKDLSIDEVLEIEFKKAIASPIREGIYRKKAFKALVITDAAETCESLKQKYSNEISVFKWDDLVQPTGRKKRLGIDRFDMYTHVYHITDGRHDNKIPDYRIPLKLLHLIYAGLTQLTTFCFNNCEDLKILWKKNDKMYETFGTELSKQEHGDGTIISADIHHLVQWLKRNEKQIDGGIDEIATGKKICFTVAEVFSHGTGNINRILQKEIRNLEGRKCTINVIIMAGQDTKLADVARLLVTQVIDNDTSLNMSDRVKILGHCM